MKVQRYSLISGEERQREHPSFWIPEIEHRTNLKAGTVVKLIFETPDGGERTWVKIEKKDGDIYAGGSEA